MGENEKSGDLDVFINGYAKNGFGGVNAMEMVCKRDAQNQLDSEGTASWIKLYQAFQTLDMKWDRHQLRDCAE